MEESETSLKARAMRTDGVGAQEGHGEAGMGEQDGRLSELYPRDLASLFSTTPEQLRAKIKGKGPAKGLAVAGAQPAHDLDLDRMQVVVRIRPSAKNAQSWAKENCIHALSTCSLAIAPPEESQGYKNGERGQTYAFSRVFGGDTPQEQFFQATAAPMVKQLLRKKQCSSVMMAYGISAAGKTHTIEGTRAEPGVLPRTLELLFKGLEHNKEGLTVRVSHCELYNEVFYDLLAPEPPLGIRPALRLKEDCQGRVFVDGLSQIDVAGPERAMELVKRSARQRQKAATALNYSSSRSHSIFTIALCRPTNGAGAEAVEQVARVSFVDLAGSERAARTGNQGLRLKESVAINSSLMTLGRCLEALRYNQQYRPAEPRLVPYRESKVTHLFRDVLHGWGQILLCVNVSPTSRDYDETARVLRYAALAAQIGVAARAAAPLRALKAVTPNITKKRAERAAAGASKLGKEAAAAPAIGPGPVDGSSAGGPRMDAVEREELEDAILELQAEVARLTEQATAAEEKAAMVEADVRDEVSNEMADLLRDMEANYRERLASELGQAAARAKRSGGGSDPKAGHATAVDSGAELKAAQERVASLETRVLELESQLALARPQSADTRLKPSDPSSSKCATRGGPKQKPSSADTPLAEALPGTSLAEALARVSELEAQLAQSESIRASDGDQRAESLAACIALDTELAIKSSDLVAAHAALAEEREKYQAAVANEATKQTELRSAEQQLAEQIHVSEAHEATIESLRAELEGAQEELRNALERVGVLEGELLEAREQLERVGTQMEARLATEVTQHKANSAMQVELLEAQLDRARKDKLQLQASLDAALHGATASHEEGWSSGKKARLRGPAGTPHDIALARARAAAAVATPGCSSAPSCSHLGQKASIEETVSPKTLRQTRKGRSLLGKRGRDGGGDEEEGLRRVRFCVDPQPTGVAMPEAASVKPMPIGNACAAKNPGKPGKSRAASAGRKSRARQGGKNAGPAQAHPPGADDAPEDHHGLLTAGPACRATVDDPPAPSCGTSWPNAAALGPQPDIPSEPQPPADAPPPSRKSRRKTHAQPAVPARAPPSDRRASAHGTSNTCSEDGRSGADLHPAAAAESTRRTVRRGAAAQGTGASGGAASSDYTATGSAGLYSRDDAGVGSGAKASTSGGGRRQRSAIAGVDHTRPGDKEVAAPDIALDRHQGDATGSANDARTDAGACEIGGGIDTRNDCPALSHPGGRKGVRRKTHFAGSIEMDNPLTAAAQAEPGPGQTRPDEQDGSMGTHETASHPAVKGQGPDPAANTRARRKTQGTAGAVLLPPVDEGSAQLAGESGLGATGGPAEGDARPGGHGASGRKRGGSDKTAQRELESAHDENSALAANSSSSTAVGPLQGARKGKRRLLPPTPMGAALREALGQRDDDEELPALAARPRRTTRFGGL